jgi:hypothetical protein
MEPMPHRGLTVLANSELITRLRYWLGLFFAIGLWARKEICWYIYLIFSFNNIRTHKHKFPRAKLYTGLKRCKNKKNLFCNPTVAKNVKVQFNFFSKQPSLKRNAKCSIFGNAKCALLSLMTLQPHWICVYHLFVQTAFVCANDFRYFSSGGL